MSPHQSPSYLLPFKPSVDISKPLASALEQLEDDFHLDSAKLQEITDRFVWEYRKGLETVATVETMKSFMCVLCSLSLARSPPASAVAWPASCSAPTSC